MDKRTMNVDLTDSDLKEVSIGDVVTVTVVGKVKSLEAGEKPPKKEKGKEKKATGCCSVEWGGFPPSMRIEVTKTSVSVGNDFEEMSKEDE